MYQIWSPWDGIYLILKRILILNLRTGLARIFRIYYSWGYWRPRSMIYIHWPVVHYTWGSLVIHFHEMRIPVKQFGLEWISRWPRKTQCIAWCRWHFIYGTTYVNSNDPKQEEIMKHNTWLRSHVDVKLVKVFCEREKFKVRWSQPLPLWDHLQGL